MDSKLPPEYLAENVHLTMEQVLDAEKKALAAIEESERQAEAILDAAREAVRALNLRADRRISRLHHLCEQRIEDMESSAEPAADRSGTLNSEEQFLLAEALKRLVHDLSRGQEDDERA